MIFWSYSIYLFIGDENGKKSYDDLIAWKNSKNRKPLLFYGARQVGKTYLVKEFGNKYFKDIIYVNFETNNIIGKIIDENISPKFIIKNLEIAFNPKYFLDALKVIDDEEIFVSFGTNISPCVIKPVDESSKDYTYMILPIRMKEE